MFLVVMFMVFAILSATGFELLIFSKVSGRCPLSLTPTFD
jgi:hypothetical protein